GFTVERIVASNWPILDESESDWKSHAAAIAQSIHLIKRRMKKLVLRLDLLSRELNKPDIWDDPMHAGKISHEHGSLMGKMKEVGAFERELLEHIDMVKLAREEDDAEMESESLKALLRMRRNSKEKELQALLSRELDSCSCYIEVYWNNIFRFSSRNRAHWQMRYLSQVAESDVNTVCFADDTGHLRYSGSDDNFCKLFWLPDESHKAVVLSEPNHQ
ncbi:Peptide chain release factor 2, partial [Morella rubra]